MKRLEEARPDVQSRRLIAWPEVRTRVSLSRSTAWRRIRDGSFPAPIRISKGRVAWVEDHVEDWIGKQIEAAKGG